MHIIKQIIKIAEKRLGLLDDNKSRFDGVEVAMCPFEGTWQVWLQRPSSDNLDSIEDDDYDGDAEIPFIPHYDREVRETEFWAIVQDESLPNALQKLLDKLKEE